MRWGVGGRRGCCGVVSGGGFVIQGVWELRLEVVEHAAQLLEAGGQLLARRWLVLDARTAFLGDGDGVCHGRVVRAAQRKRQLLDTELGGDLFRAAVEHGVGTPALLVDNLDVGHLDAAREPRAQRLEHGLLRGEEHGVVDGGAVVRLGVRALLLAEHPARERRRAHDDLLHARDLDDVDAQARARRVGLRLLGRLGLLALHYSTVTDFARLRGWSTSQPRSRAT